MHLHESTFTHMHMHTHSFKEDFELVCHYRPHSACVSLQTMASNPSFADLKAYVLSNASTIREAKVQHLTTYINRGFRAKDKARIGLANFLKRNELTPEQKAEFEALEAQVCELGITVGSGSANSSSALGALQKDCEQNESKFNELSQYISAHADEIRKAGKRSLHAYFFSNRDKRGEVNKFADFLNKKRHTFTEAQKQRIENWKNDLCCSQKDKQDDRDLAMDELLPTSQQPVLMPDIVRFWKHGVRLPGCHVFLKSVRQEFVTATADGDKYFECSTARNIFMKMDAGDLLLLVQTRSQQ